LASNEPSIQHKGWKLIDLTEDRRVHAEELLQKLEEKTYKNIDEVIKYLK